MYYMTHPVCYDFMNWGIKLPELRHVNVSPDKNSQKSKSADV